METSPPPPPPPILSPSARSTVDATPIASSSSELVTFQLKISEKLDEQNFLIWKQQIELVVNAHNLQSFLYFTEIPNKYATDPVTSAIVENPAYHLWVRQDQWLLSWLQSTISRAVMSRILVSSLYQESIDSLASVGDPIPSQQHIDVILEGLQHDYGSVVSVIESKFEDIQLEEVEALLLAHEMRLSKYNKQVQIDTASINLTQAKSPSEASGSNPPSGSSSQSDSATSSNFVDVASGFQSSGYGSGSRGRGNRGRGRGRYGSVQCQVCFKFGHLAAMCYHRFNQNFQAPVPHDFQGFPGLGPGFPGFAPQGGAPFHGYANTWIRP
ncbi:retrovirus-related pol polyprotein from transposon TNT 1-94, partial [Trifolium medium]|nr:retrovirus-related pol polyprotein from transposon TNT 1-94 [Trifolium medium]